MADIVTSRIFADGEKNITAAKLNDIVGSSVIQPAFVSAKPSTSTVAPTDNLLVLTAAQGTYAKAPFQTVIDSVNANLNTNAAIWSVRLRSFNAIGNPTFEVDQRSVGNFLANPVSGTLFQDRWSYGHAGTLACSIGRSQPYNVVVPGTNFVITSAVCQMQLTTAQASLGATDYLMISQRIEGPRWRELLADVHSISLLVQSSVAGLNFGVALRDLGPSLTTTKSLCLLCTIPSANTPTLITLPNLPGFPSGNFTSAAGAPSYELDIVFAAGTAYVAPAANTWQNGNFLAPPGIDNFASKPVNSTFLVAFVQHEPGSVCSTLMDCTFEDNYRSALRYYCKSNPYGTLPSANSGIGSSYGTAINTATVVRTGVHWPVPMAKTPTVRTFYSGTVNQILIDGQGAVGVSSVLPDSRRMGTINLSTAATTTNSTYGDWDADTGW
jgi:hypothetical protein